MKKRPINWPLGNLDFVAWEVEAAAGLLVARRNHPLVDTGERLCQGWDLWLEGKFAGALNSRTLSDLATLSREELLKVTRPAAAAVIVNSSLTSHACCATLEAVPAPTPGGGRKATPNESSSI